ncbi:lipopolysaccharide heptosyltransferase I [Rhodoferax sp.]|uniref:lipopolysaccharide heptosyltransferase I n=1 Tax=Rhodoferax sp. TaxID=50421 RepID=UPI0025E88FCE|nr:lipopolysaccharide heptosyltransferase I [Rhodoferax sp.]MCM2342508.1 lipopolysaccharide heptosyltransferase I [Rhodoferax sp.]
MKILIVKLSSLGDVVHAMPAVQDILRALPEAKIDWVVERGFAPLVQRCQGVHRIIASDLRRWRKTPFSTDTRRAWSVFKLALQQEPYDAVIDLQGLTKSALVSWLARLSPGGQRYGLANQTEGSSFEAPARWVAHRAITLPAHCHAVTRSRDLCARALHYRVPDELVFGLLAQQDQTAVQAQAPESGLHGVVALVHGTSRADKQWPLAHWRALAQRLDGAGFGVVLPHGSPAELQTAHDIAQGLAHARVWPVLPLDAFTDALATCSGVIGVDSGLSHIAVALDLPHVQIYNFDTAWRTGPVDESKVSPRQCSVFAQPTPSVDAVWQAWQIVLSNSVHA